MGVTVIGERQSTHKNDAEDGEDCSDRSSIDAVGKECVRLVAGRMFAPAKDSG